MISTGPAGTALAAGWLSSALCALPGHLPPLAQMQRKKTGAACSNIPVSKPLNSTSALLHIPHPCRRQTPFKAANIKRAHFL